MIDIHIEGTGQYGIFYSGANGNGTYCHITYTNIGTSTNTSIKPTAFSFMEDCSNTAIPVVNGNEFRVLSNKDSLTISGLINSTVSLYDMMGNLCCKKSITTNETVIYNLKSGIYLVRMDRSNKIMKVMVR